MSEPLKTLSDSPLLTSTAQVVSTLRRIDLILLEHLAEIEVRELHLKAGYSSLFKMCTDKFRLSEASAYRRVAASRLIQRYPSAKAQLLAGEVSMCTLATVAARINDLPGEDDRQELLTAISGKSKSEVEELLAQRNAGVPAKRRDVIRPMRTPQGSLQATASGAPQGSLQLTKENSVPLSPVQVTASEKVSYRIAFTASTSFRSKLQKAQDLLKHKHPNGNLEAILEAALDHLIKSRDLAQKQGRKSNGATRNPRYIPAAIKRHVTARDAGQCAFTGAEGNRCQEKAGLEFEHRVPFAKGGSSADLENIELLCRGHNAWRARQKFSKSRQLSGRAKHS